jgi:aspartyl-tRNA(Asn)/glutamyl-tRNA(Gln) amidotransferase subunit A
MAGDGDDALTRNRMRRVTVYELKHPSEGGARALGASTAQWLAADPLQGLSLREFGARLRRGALSAEAVTRAYCDRITSRDQKIGAFVTVATREAIAAARNFDALLRSGKDLGALMGVPIAVKEIFAIDGFPYGAGTQLDLTVTKPSQGPFIQSLRDAGCIILGTTRTTEFAAATINLEKPMPWNPADETVKRVCGGSSHGSAAALAAGLCAFSVGSDTGGSVRLPAALCGVFGFKSTAGVWPTEGIFSLSPTLDSVGVFTRCADDAALIFSTLAKQPDQQAPDIRGLRFGIPQSYFYDDLDEPVRHAVDTALERLRDAGAALVEVQTSDVAVAMPTFGKLLFGEFVAGFGEDRLKAQHSTIDPVPWARIQAGFDTDAKGLAAARTAQKAAVAAARERMAHVDALLYPTAPFVPCPVSEVRTLDSALAWNLRSGRLTRPGNFFGQCGTSLPVQAPGELPVGLQVICTPAADSRLLAISLAVENTVRPSAANNKSTRR